MHFVVQTPALQHLAAVKIIAGLWNQRDILKQIAELSGPFEEVVNKWKVVRNTVDANALALKLPKPCKRQLLNFTEPMGTEIFTWCRYHYMDVNENKEVTFLKCTLPERFCWTMHGIIDNAKSAELMLKDQNLSIERRYEIACITCLEDEARELFPLVAENRRREYMNKVIDLGSNEVHVYNIVFITCTLLGDVDQLIVCFQQILSRGVSIHHCLFFRSLFSGNRVACDYFFSKLSQRELEYILGRKASTLFDTCADISPFHLLLYYLSLLSEAQQERLFRESMGDVLVCLLGFPMQSLFMEAAECGWRYMANRDYERVLRAIARKISDGAKDYHYSQLFLECWSLTPTDAQRLLLDNVEFLDKLVDTQQEEIVDLLCKEAPAHQLLALFKRNDKLRRALMNENTTSDATLMAFKERAALVSSKDKEDEKRLRSECLDQLVDIAMEERIKRRRLV